MSGKHAVDWFAVMDMRRYMSRVAQATGIDDRHVNRFIAQEADALKRVNPQAADELCGGALAEIAHGGIRETWREVAWMWLAGQSLIDKAGV